jgi:hypothetical protein
MDAIRAVRMDIPVKAANVHRFINSLYALQIRQIINVKVVLFAAPVAVLMLLQNAPRTPTVWRTEVIRIV